jgi:hypothetical protein
MRSNGLIQPASWSFATDHEIVQVPHVGEHRAFGYRSACWDSLAPVPPSCPRRLA